MVGISPSSPLITSIHIQLLASSDTGEGVVMDYRAGMKQQGIGSKGEVSPTDRSDKTNGWIDWAVSSRSEDPALLASALEEAALSLADWVGV